MRSSIAPSRASLVVSLVAALSLTAACGDGEGVKATEGSELPGDPITVMTITPVNSAVLSYPDVFAAAQAAVDTINDGGGIAGRGLRLITCDDQADANKAAACARQAVEEKAVAVVGGINTAGATILPILEAAGIPWIGPPGFSANELNDKNSYPMLLGSVGSSALGYKAASDGCEKIASIHVDTPVTDRAIALVNAGVEAAGGEPVTSVRVPSTTTDFSAVAKATEGHDCVIVGLLNEPTIALAKSGLALGLRPRYYLITGALNATTVEGAGEAFEGAVSLQPFKAVGDPVWDAAKEAAPDIDWSYPYHMSTWAAFQLLAQVGDSLPEVSAETVTSALEAATGVDAGGIAAPIDFTKPFSSEGLSRVMNHQEISVRVEDGSIVQETDFHDVVAPLFPS